MAVDRYPFSEIEAKWQQLWEEKDLFKVTLRVDNPMRLYWTSLLSKLARGTVRRP